MTWHPIHPLLVSGGSEGSLLYWDVNAPEPTSSSTSLVPQAAGPRATLAEAHDSNVWALAFHPLGHLLASASNDHTTRFWARERPGDASSTFSGGGARPPGAAEEDAEDADGDEDEQGMSVPGLMSFAGGIPGIGGGMGMGQGQAFGKEEEHGRTDSPFRRQDGMGMGMGGEDGIPGIPGFGRPMEDNRVPNHRPPPQDDGYGDRENDRGGRWGGGEGYRDRERDRDRDQDRPYRGGRGGGRSARWGPRRDRGGGRY